MAFSKVLWLGTRKRFWRQARHALAAVLLAPPAFWLASGLAPAGTVTVCFLAFAALLYQSHAIAVIVGIVWNFRPESRRKLAHLIGGGWLLVASAMPHGTALVVALCALMLAWMIATRTLRTLRNYRQLSVDRRDGSRSWGDLLFPFGMAGPALLAGTDAPAWLAAALILVVADSAAALVGTRWGRRRYRLLAGRKSLEGSLAFFGCALVLLLATSAATGAAWPPGLCVGAAALATAVEACCGHGWDNLLLPWAVVAGLGTLSPLSGTTLLMLALALAVAVTALAGVQERLAAPADDG